MKRAVSVEGENMIGVSSRHREKRNWGQHSFKEVYSEEKETSGKVAGKDQ